MIKPAKLTRLQRLLSWLFPLRVWGGLTEKQVGIVAASVRVK